MIKRAVSLLLSAVLTAALTPQVKGQQGKGIPHLDRVFVIVMENHGYQQVAGNPNEPYLNSLIASKKVNLATNYFAVGHPSLTNYLEIVGGSNFGIRSDNDPAWHDNACTPNLISGAVNADNAVATRRERLRWTRAISALSPERARMRLQKPSTTGMK